MKLPKDPKQCIFLMTKMADGTPLVMIGIPDAGWKHMKDGKTSNYDLTIVGLPIALSIFGGKDQASIIATIESGAKAEGIDIRDYMGVDFSIDPSKH